MTALDNITHSFQDGDWTLHLQTKYVPKDVAGKIWKVMLTLTDTRETRCESIVLRRYDSREDAETIHYNVKDVLTGSIETNRGISQKLLDKYGFKINILSDDIGGG